MQNLEFGPFGPGNPDDQFGGHGASVGGPVGDNLQEVLSYGHRNGFGFDFDPVSGQLWLHGRV
jgi:aldose sugar dehydrogenase